MPGLRRYLMQACVTDLEEYFSWEMAAVNKTAEAKLLISGIRQRTLKPFYRREKILYLIIYLKEW